MVSTTSPAYLAHQVLLALPSSSDSWFNNSLVLRWLDEGIDTTVRDSVQQTPLLKAARCRAWHIVERLLAMGADGSVADWHGITLLHHAVQAGSERWMAAAMSCGVDVHAPLMTTGDTPLHLAVHAENLPVAAWLIARGADFRPNAAGRTPWDVAAQASSPSVLVELRLGWQRHEEQRLVTAATAAPITVAPSVSMRL